ncbi:MAG: molybdopterin converting factor subunit 1 [Pseudomonadota bacterium]|jgi:molybdopterin synthase sulfur carrier subunit
MNAPSVSIQVLYFASVRERMGRPRETVQIRSGSTIGQLRQLLMDQSAQGQEALALAKGVRVAVNQQMTHDDQVLCAGDEVAFFPPVTGG